MGDPVVVEIFDQMEPELIIPDLVLPSGLEEESSPVEPKRNNVVDIGRIKQEETSSPFQCFVCGAENRSQQDLIRHYQSLHALDNIGTSGDHNAPAKQTKDNPLIGEEGPPDPLVDENNIDILQDMCDIEKKRGVLFCCTVCGYTSADRINAGRHMVRHINIKSMTCQDCLYIFSDEYYFKDYVSAGPWDQRHTCPHCNFKTHWHQHLKNHTVQHHNESANSIIHGNTQNIHSTMHPSHSGGQVTSVLQANSQLLPSQQSSTLSSNPASPPQLSSISNQQAASPLVHLAQFAKHPNSPIIHHSNPNSPTTHNLLTLHNQDSRSASQLKSPLSQPSTPSPRIQYSQLNNQQNINSSSQPNSPIIQHGNPSSPATYHLSTQHDARYAHPLKSPINQSSVQSPLNQLSVFTNSQNLNHTNQNPLIQNSNPSSPVEPPALDGPPMRQELNESWWPKSCQNADWGLIGDKSNSSNDVTRPLLESNRYREQQHNIASSIPATIQKTSPTPGAIPDNPPALNITWGPITNGHPQVTPQNAYSMPSSINTYPSQQMSYTNNSQMQYHQHSYTQHPYVSTSTNPNDLNLHYQKYEPPSRYFPYPCGETRQMPNAAAAEKQKATKAKPYACNLCPYRGSQSAQLKRHMKRTHNQLAMSDNLRSLLVQN